MLWHLINETTKRYDVLEFFVSLYQSISYGVFQHIHVVKWQRELQDDFCCNIDVITKYIAILFVYNRLRRNVFFVAKEQFWHRICSLELH